MKNFGHHEDEALNYKGKLFDRVVQHFIPPGDPEHAWSMDACRFRKNSRCMYPTSLDPEGTAQAGYSVWHVEDRGFCPRVKQKQQWSCPLFEPGPNSGDPNALIEVTKNWDEGGQRI